MECVAAFPDEIESEFGRGPKVCVVGFDFFVIQISS